VTTKSLTAMTQYTSKIKASFSWLSFWNINLSAAGILAASYVYNNGDSAIFSLLNDSENSFRMPLFRTSDFLFRSFKAKLYTNN
jgi:hypothetical protein